jgi:adenosylmethionine-8-amino-7-oxononanoate aminotransferase
VIRARVASDLHRAGFAHGHTYVVHPTACAAGVAVQKVLDREQLLARTRQMGTLFLSMLQRAFGEHRNVGDIRGRGLFFGIELVADRETRAGFSGAGKMPEELRIAALDEGLICYPGGIEIADRTVPHIMMAPPMIVAEHHMRECIDKLTAVFNRVLPQA